MQGVTKRSNADGDIGLDARPEPRPRPGHVVLEVAAAGICGTDLHIRRGEYLVRPPVTVGHEVCGVVTERGEGVDAAWDGRRVVAETFFDTCGRCRHCRSGRPNLCRERRSIGTHVDGAMAPRVELPVWALHDVPAGLSDAAASLAEPVACVANSLFDAGAHVELGDRVLVVGPGAIGLLAAQVARACGGHVTVRGTASDRARLDLAERLGCAISTVGDDLEEESFDKAVECSGAGAGAADAIRLLDRRGHLMQMGLSGHDASLPFDLVCYRELTVTAGFASTPASWRRAMAMIRAGRLELEALVTDVLPLRAWEAAFDRSAAADGIKLVLDPRIEA